jgi:Ca-activated chloride channel homolog
MRDAIRVSIDHLKEKAKRDKVILVVTDGNDNASAISLDALVRLAVCKKLLRLRLPGRESSRPAR